MKIFVFLLVLFSLPALAAIEAYPFPNEELRTRYNQLIDELRCPQCLNTNLAGSDAMIAQDLRREVHRMLLDGKGDQEILDFMYERYGDFILYSPRVTPGTFVLWFGPIGLLLIAALIVGRVVVSRRASRAEVLADVDRDRLDRLLSGK
ncbi:MAG: cytochrome c-type biogenesis protein CcmH [Pseudomonadota bacterium]